MTAPVPAPAWDPKGMTIEQAVAEAYKRSPDVMLARFAVAAARADRITAGLRPNPNLDLGASNFPLTGKCATEWQNPGTPAACANSFDQLLFVQLGADSILDVWSKRPLRVAAAEDGVGVQQLTLRDEYRVVAETARAAYDDLVVLSEQEVLAKNALLHAQGIADLAHKRYLAGATSAADDARTQLDLLEAQRSEIDAEQALVLAQDQFQAALGFSPSAPAFTLNPVEHPPLVDLDVTTLTGQAERDRPDLRAATLARKQAEDALALQERNAYPDPDLGLNVYKSNLTSSPPDWGAGLSLTVPMPVFDRNQGNIAHARSDLASAQATERKTRLRVDLDVYSAVDSQQRALAKLRHFENDGMLARAEQVRRAAEASYISGASSLLELRQAERDYLATYGEYLSDLDDYRQSLIALAAATSGPVIGEPAPSSAPAEP